MHQSQATSLFTFQGGLDNELLYELYESDYQSVLQTFQIFLDEIESNIQELDQFYKAQDITSFRKTVHRIKPVFSYVGLSEMYKIFQAIEEKCNEVDDVEKISPPFNELVKNIRTSAELVTREKQRLELFIAKK